MMLSFIFATNICFSRPLFTGKERDAESGNDYFGARYYASSMGRFLSPDPGWFFATNPTNPQTWNLYSYVLNNPLNAVDPDGFDCVYLNNAGTDVDRDANGNPTGIDQNSNKGECDTNGGKWVNGTVTNVYLSSTSNDVYLTGQAADGSQTSSGTDYVSGGSSSVIVTGDPTSVNGVDGSVLALFQENPLSYESLRSFDPWSARLFGSHWCGPEGAASRLMDWMWPVRPTMSASPLRASRLRAITGVEV
jgi:RHS repeat-associated protein